MDLLDLVVLMVNLDLLDLLVLTVLLVLLDNKREHISREEVISKEEVRGIEETIDARMVVGPDKEEQDGRIDKVTNKGRDNSKDLEHRQELGARVALEVVVDLVALVVLLDITELKELKVS